MEHHTSVLLFVGEASVRESRRRKKGSVWVASETTREREKVREGAKERGNKGQRKYRRERTKKRE